MLEIQNHRFYHLKAPYGTLNTLNSYKKTCTLTQFGCLMTIWQIKGQFTTGRKPSLLQRLQCLGSEALFSLIIGEDLDLGFALVAVSPWTRMLICILLSKAVTAKPCNAIMFQCSDEQRQLLYTDSAILKGVECGHNIVVPVLCCQRCCRSAEQHPHIGAEAAEPALQATPALLCPS